MKRVLYFIFIVTLFTSCKATNYEITSKTFTNMVNSNHVDSIEIIDLLMVEVYLEPGYIENYKNEFPNIDLTGPQFYFTIGSVDLFEKYISELQSGLPRSELIKVKYSNRNSLNERLLILLLEIHSLIVIIFFVIILSKKFKRKSDKIVWIVMVVCLPIIGILLFGLIGKKQIVKSNSL